MSFINQIFEVKEQQLPMLNYLYQQRDKGIFNDYLQFSRKRRMMYLVKRSPEAYSILEAHAWDIVGQFHFEPVRSSTGKILVNRANKFCSKNQFKKLLFHIVFDALATGEGFIWKRELNSAQMAVIKQELQRVLNMERSDEELFKMRDMLPMASSTVAVNHDNHYVTGYTQTIYGDNTYERKFSHDEVVRVTFSELDGKVEGWTPLYTMPIQFELLWLMWSNQYDFQARGNHPDLVVMAEGLRSNDPSYKLIEEKLMQYNTPGNSKHGTLLLNSGKYTIQQLERMDTLQFKEAGQFIQTLIASQFQFPMSRLGIKTEEAAKTKDSAGGNDKGYYNLVEQKQDVLSNILNAQIWEPYFGVRMVHDKSYKHDELVEGQSLNWNLNNVKLLNDMLRANYGTQLKPESLYNIYNRRVDEITDADIEEADMSMIEPVKGTLNNQPDKLTVNGADQDNRDEKRQIQSNNERNKGKPTGV